MRSQMKAIKSEIYNVSGLEIVITPVYEGLEAKFTRNNNTYRIKMAPGADVPWAGRYHPSMALAEPVIPHHVYSAMLNAVAQHTRHRN